MRWQQQQLAGQRIITEHERQRAGAVQRHHEHFGERR
jgi:hypothetical protein